MKHILLLPLLALCAFTALADPSPKLIPFQGRLTDQNGIAYTNGTFTILFQLYNDAVGGTAIWTERHEKVGVVHGIVNVFLGSINSLNAVTFDQTKHLGITVDADNNPNTPDPEMVPRQMIIPSFWSKYAESAGFAQNAQIAQSAQVAMQLQVSNTVALRLAYPTTGVVPNLVGGFSGNSVGAGTEGAVIAGGGISGNVNSIGLDSDFSFVGGGLANNISSNSFNSTIAGGTGNSISFDSFQSFIGGGLNNSISSNSSKSTIAGGSGNNIGFNSVQCFIGGGVANNISSDSLNSTIAGGAQNVIAVNSSRSFIGGGLGNNISANSSLAIIAGGFDNSIGAGSGSSTIGGGQNNRISSNSANAIIAGGNANEIELNSGHSVIGGGQFNRILSGSSYSVIPGGLFNVVSTNATTAFAAGFYAKARHHGAFVWGDQSVSADVVSTNADSVTFRASGGMRFFSSTNTTSPAPGVYLAPNASSWSTTSDRNAKKDFAPVDGAVVLEKLINIPVQRWHYNWEETSATPHIGPMAQDFKAAFYPGRDDKSITTLEFDGIALAAIQGLNQKLEAENAKLKTKNAAIEQRLSALEKLLNRLTTAQNTGGQ